MFTIKRSFRKDDILEAYSFRALDENGQTIFGAEAEVSRKRERNVYTTKAENDSLPAYEEWEEWVPSWGGTYCNSYQKMLPFFAVIRRAMKLAEKKNSR